MAKGKPGAKAKSKGRAPHEWEVVVRFALWVRSPASSALLPAGPRLLKGGIVDDSLPPEIDFVCDTPEQAEEQAGKLEKYLNQWEKKFKKS